ncbi:AMMECR1 like protein,putative [Babesia bigemina]|uniref:AMMECR1 like protein,putative n=1 Tax=Babesia bigemina TaxID=5866 RepID=A0A061DBR1_BABBI|nr:AMMECR1 like protein,putative [Babesia bigemina]CDR95190.1 AMMECR1 like protein,putative [Babesia bigemina]|eukprot:XP_012767376.1 AMMECR1 like protein,putative [Babesia bigemina]
MVTPIDDVIDQVDNTLCAACFDAIYCAINNKLLQWLVEKNVSCPIFVTWMIADHNGNDELRGCIGTLSPVPISQIGHYAKMSAFEDTRFPPISGDELPRLMCGVSLLHTYEAAANPHDWEIGKHGVIVKFEQNGRQYSATYLPEVAEEHNMSREDAVKQLVRKAGYRGALSQELLSSVKVTRYQSKKLKLSFREYASLEHDGESEQ